MATYNIDFVVTFTVDAKDAESAEAKAWHSGALSHYVEGVDVVTNVEQYGDARLAAE
jgi:hypothetical protein